MMQRISLAAALVSATWCGAAGTAPEPRGRVAAAPKPNPITPPTREAVDNAIRRGVDFLVRRQNKNGSWGSARNTKGLNIYAPVPGAHHAFRTATTSLCLSALIEAGDSRPATRRAVERGETWMLANLGKLRRATPRAIYNTWGHAYAIQALVRMAQRRPMDPARLKHLAKLIEDQIGFLARYETVHGGWGYYDFEAHTQKPSGQPTSFLTATVLIAFAEAKAVGVAAPQKLVRRALATIHRQRKPDSSYLYSGNLTWWPMAGINRPAGSLGRSQACNAALRLWGDKRITDDVLRTWLDRLFARSLWLDIGRKRPVPHESWFQVAGYFFYYGHYYAGLCIDLLKPEERPHFQDHLAHILLRLQEKDGTWWDYPLYDYHQQYGTAFALMALQRCRKGTAAGTSGRTK